MELFNTTTMSAVHKALDTAQLRQQVIANNIANANTPGFKKSSVRFEDQLAAALSNKGIAGTRTDARHIPIGKPRIDSVQPRLHVHGDTSLNNNLNNVDIDAEMTELAKTQIWYDALATNMNGRFNKMRTAIGGR